MNNMNTMLGNSKPLIHREQNYVLDRKLITVHSEDRDITKWPNSNHFEIMLPETLLNVQSMRITQVTMPSHFDTFSNNYQNTKLQFTMENDPENKHQITINDGTYTPTQLAFELKNKMNQQVTPDHSFNVLYNEVTQKIWIGHTDVSFNLNFCDKINYDFSNCDQAIVWDNHSNWGLPSYLGFQKKCYSSTNNSSGIVFDYLASNGSNADLVHYVEAPLPLNIGGETSIYMEVDKYNSFDELYPYNKSSRLMYDNNAYTGKVNSAFAKIPIKNHDSKIQDSRTLYLHNLVHYDPPIERLTRLNIKFRFHDGRLVDFKNFPFDFTFEVNSLRNEINKQYNIRIPATFIL